MVVWMKMEITSSKVSYTHEFELTDETPIRVQMIVIPPAFEAEVEMR